MSEWSVALYTIHICLTLVSLHSLVGTWLDRVLDDMHDEIVGKFTEDK